MRNEPSRTAEAVCSFRASDQRRPPEARIVDDPYARWFLGPVMRAALATVEASGRLGQRAEELSSGLVSYVLTRHRFIDDSLAQALNGDVEQVVLLGAGYDTRAYRFADALAGRPVFELDFPATSRRKGRIVDEHASELPNSRVHRVEIDFTEEHIEGALEQAGFRRGAPTFFVWEGVSMYLPRDAVKATLQTLRTMSAPGSGLSMDFWFLLDSPDLIAAAHRFTPNLLHFLGEPMTFSMHPEDTPGFVERVGWEVTDLADHAELERRYVRDDRRVYPACHVITARASAG